MRVREEIAPQIESLIFNLGTQPDTCLGTKEVCGAASTSLRA